MTEAYKVGITIALNNKISQGLAMIGKDLVKTEEHAARLKKSLAEIKKLAVTGAIFGGVGYAMLKPLEAGYEAAKKYEQALNQFKALNLGDVVNRQADKFARGANVIGASATDMISTLRDLTTVFGDKDINMTAKLAPRVAQMKFANQAIFGEHGMDFSQSQLKAMEKIIEMRGGFKSPEAFMAQANMMQKVVSGTGGMVKPSDYMQFIQTAGVAGRLMNDDVFYYTMEPLIQEMHAGRVGTGTMSAYNNLAQGRSTVRAAQEMMKLGIVDPSMVEWTKIGTVKRIKPGALKGMDEFTSDPYHWMKDILLPAFAKQGINSESAIYNEMGAIFGNRTGSNLFSLMFKQQDKIEKNMAISKNALDVNDLVKLAKSSPQGANAAVAAAWENLKIATGEVLIPIIIPALLKLAQAMRDMGQWIDRHPIRFEYIVKGFAGLGAAMAITGTLMLVTAGFKALGLVLKVGSGFTALLSGLRLALTGLLFTPLGAIVAGISAVVVVGYEVYKHWDVIKPKLLAVWDGIKSWISGILDWLQGVGHNIMGGSSAVASSKPSYAYAKTGFAPPSSGGRTVQVSTQLNVDGRTIARAVTDHQYYDMNRDLAAGGGFDGRLSFASPGVP